MIEINLADIIEIQTCADCGRPVGFDDGPHNGWQLEDGRTVCQKCCIVDTGKTIKALIEFCKETKAEDDRDVDLHV